MSYLSLTLSLVQGNEKIKRSFVFCVKIRKKYTNEIHDFLKQREMELYAVIKLYPPIPINAAPAMARANPASLTADNFSLIKKRWRKTVGAG